MTVVISSVTSLESTRINPPRADWLKKRSNHTITGRLQIIITGYFYGIIQGLVNVPWLPWLGDYITVYPQLDDVQLGHLPTPVIHSTNGLWLATVSTYDR